MIVHTEDLDHMPQRYRVQLVNSLSGFKSANLIGTISTTGITNLAMVSSVFHLGADPALLGYISRPPTVPRDTLTNIEATRFFTVNHCHGDIFRQGHQTSARYPSELSEFAATQLNEAYTPTLPAPYVAESRLKMGVRFVEKKVIEVNQTVLVIGEIIEIILPDEALCEDGHVKLDTLDTVCVSGLDRYHRTTELARLKYAKPNPST